MSISKSTQTCIEVEIQRLETKDDMDIDESDDEEMTTEEVEEMVKEHFLKYCTPTCVMHGHHGERVFIGRRNIAVQTE